MSKDALEQLRPIVFPEYDVSVWPLAAGWWCLIALIFITVASFMLFRPALLLRRHEKQIQKDTLRLLNDLYEGCKVNTDTAVGLQIYLQKSNEIFKRVIHKNSYLSEFSSLAGNDWVTFITTFDTGSPFSKFYGNNLYASRCNEKLSLDELHQWAIEWAPRINKRAKAFARKNKKAGVLK